MPQIAIERHPQEIHYFAEPLHPSAKSVIAPINMVLILGGTFQMGSPETEIDRRESESPQHPVTVPSFFMSEYPITQAHWSVVAQMQPVEIKLEIAPSRFQGLTRPVERVSWHEAVEFCQRLSLHSGRTYRLPMEAEWEYACRAGTMTPFYCGETISTDLANYDGNYAYGQGEKSFYRQETTPVNEFLPNAFGLYDMHGNVWEWCLDHWHDDYEGAPTDGSAWLSQNNSSARLLRGSSWYSNHRYCCSAVRDSYNPDFRVYTIGLRVVCEIPRTP